MSKPPTHSPRQLTRSRTDRKLAGVCGGLGAYFGIDPLLIRVLFVATAIAGGAAILVYLLLALFVPPERRSRRSYRHMYSSKRARGT